MSQGAPDKKEVEEKEKQLRENIAKNYSHIKNVEAQLSQLQLQLKLTSGPKKSALEMLRRKIEAKNEQVVAARQKFISAQKVAEQAEEVLRSHERSKEQLCQELHLLVHQSATAELNKLEQLTKQLEQLNGGRAKPSSEIAAIEQAVAEQVTSSKNTPSAEDAAAATTEQQALAAADASRQPQAGGTSTQGPDSQPGRGPATPEGQKPKPAVTAKPPLPVHVQQAQSDLPVSKQIQQQQQQQQPQGRRKSNQNRKQPMRDSSPATTSDSSGRFAGFES